MQPVAGPYPVRNFIRFFSFRSYYVAALLAGVLLALWLAGNGMSAPEFALLGAYAVGAVLLQRRIGNPPARPREFDALAAFDRVLREGRPTLLEFYSDQCAASMLNRALMDGLEREAGQRLQILCVNLRDSLIGKALADRYGVTFTPTFILFNERGQREEEFVFAINRARVLYWLNRHFPGDNRPLSLA